MILNLKGDLAPIRKGLAIQQKELGFTISADGLPVDIKQRQGPLKITLAKVNSNLDHAIIEYNQPIHFFRTLALLTAAVRDNRSLEIQETPCFDTLGVMLDCSRNAVLKVETVKRMLRKMANMGLNMLMLYTEDTYEVPEKPFFGYMRGAYSESELRECDEYAAALGIEMIPCIQTLSHLEKYLRWPAADTVRDTPRTLLADHQETYQFLEKLIAAASRPFRTRRIHIGMDEASDMGLGASLRQHGYQAPFPLFLRHLKGVNEITRQHKLKPMIWSDMLFKFASTTHSGYDPETKFSSEILAQMPAEIQPVYWRYGCLPIETHRQLLRQHRELSRKEPMFAGGVFTWGRFGVNYDITLPALANSLTACKLEKVREAMVTLWGDDGQEGNYFGGLLGLQYLAEHGYHDEEPDSNTLQQRIRDNTGIKHEAFIDLSRLNQDEQLGEHENLAKTLLWQDPLLGLADADIDGQPLERHFQELSRTLESHRQSNSAEGMVFDVPTQLARLLAGKAELGLRLRKAYNTKDHNTLKTIATEELPSLRRLAKELKDIHRKQWMRLNKPFGWEILDIRYGGLISRLETAEQRLKEYLRGEVKEVEELEAEVLPVRIKPRYGLLASACPLV